MTAHGQPRALSLTTFLYDYDRTHRESAVALELAHVPDASHADDVLTRVRSSWQRTLEVLEAHTWPPRADGAVADLARGERVLHLLEAGDDAEPEACLMGAVKLMASVLTPCTTVPDDRAPRLAALAISVVEEEPYEVLEILDEMSTWTDVWTPEAEAQRQAGHQLLG